jgi:hypothetical protein
MKVVIHHNDKEGMIQYDPDDRQVMVSHPDEYTRRIVNSYLNHRRDFTVAGELAEGEKGGRMRLTASPIDHSDIMDLALNEMKAHIGVQVNWGDKRNRPSKDHKELHNKLVPPVENDKANKPILKSIDGDTDYEIIN